MDTRVLFPVISLSSALNSVSLFSLHYLFIFFILLPHFFFHFFVFIFIHSLVFILSFFPSFCILIFSSFSLHSLFIPVISLFFHFLSSLVFPFILHPYILFILFLLFLGQFPLRSTQVLDQVCIGRESLEGWR